MNKFILLITIVCNISILNIKSQNCIENNEINFNITREEFKLKFKVKYDNPEYKYIRLFNADTITDQEKVPFRTYDIYFNESGAIDTIYIKLLDMSYFGYYAENQNLDLCRSYFNLYYSCIIDLNTKFDSISLVPQSWRQGKYTFELFYDTTLNWKMIHFKIYLN